MLFQCTKYNPARCESENAGSLIAQALFRLLASAAIAKDIRGAGQSGRLLRVVHEQQGSPPLLQMTMIRLS